MVFFKTLSHDDKRDYYTETLARANLEHSDDTPDPRREVAIFRPADLYAIHVALENLGFEVKPELLANLSAALVKSNHSAAIVTLNIPVLGANAYRA